MNLMVGLEPNVRLRKLVDNCDNVQERIAVDYRKKPKLGFEVYPSPTISTYVVEPYNALLTTYWLLDHTEVSVVLDNEAIYEICQNPDSNISISKSYQPTPQILIQANNSSHQTYAYNKPISDKPKSPSPAMHILSKVPSLLSKTKKKTDSSIDIGVIKLNENNKQNTLEELKIKAIKLEESPTFSRQFFITTSIPRCKRNERY